MSITELFASEPEHQQALERFEQEVRHELQNDEDWRMLSRDQQDVIVGALVQGEIQQIRTARHQATVICEYRRRAATDQASGVRDYDESLVPA